jgi:hypothetical protein
MQLSSGAKARIVSGSSGAAEAAPLQSFPERDVYFATPHSFGKTL